MVAIVGMFDLNREELEKEYSNHREYRIAKRNITIIEKCNKSQYKNADLIVQYDNDGKVVLVVERVWKEEYNMLNWLRLVLVNYWDSLFSVDNKFIRHYKHSKDYMDIATCSKTWYDWVKDLLKEI